MIDLYDLLHQIQAKPGLYIGVPSISNLYMFLNGYQFARRQLELPLSAQEQEFRAFQPWLQQQLGMQTTESWSQLILAQTADEAAALAYFFALFQAFLVQRQADRQGNGQGNHIVNGARLEV